jgi:hypothetical protein
MGRVSFRTKIKHDLTGSGVYPDWIGGDKARREWIKLPSNLAAKIDRQSFHKCPEWSSYSNSDLLPSMVLNAMLKAGQVHRSGDDCRIMVDAKGVTVDRSGFLADITIEVGSWR